MCFIHSALSILLFLGAPGLGCAPERDRSPDAFHLERLFTIPLDGRTPLKSTSGALVLEDGSAIVLDYVGQQVVRITSRGEISDRHRFFRLPDGALGGIIARSTAEDGKWLVASADGQACLWFTGSDLQPLSQKCILPAMLQREAVAILKNGLVVLGRVSNSKADLHYVKGRGNTGVIEASAATTPIGETAGGPPLGDLRLGQLVGDGAFLWYADYSGHSEQVSIRKYSPALDEIASSGIPGFDGVEGSWEVGSGGTVRLLDLFERTTGLAMSPAGPILSSYSPTHDESIIRQFDTRGVVMAEARVPFRLEIVGGGGDHLLIVTEIATPELALYRVIPNVGGGS